MLPNNVLSTQQIVAQFLPPYDIAKGPLLDYELGGVNLNDSSQGLRVKTWKAEYISGQVVLSAPGVTPTAVLTKAGLSSLSFTFDQNMRVAIAYELENGDPPEFYWFDNTIGQYTTLVLSAGTITAKCKLDDKRDAQSPISDIILAYIRAGALYFRAQRDRYTNEYQLTNNLQGASRLVQIGMNRVHRFQFQLR